jgi:hypothetical protein
LPQEETRGPVHDPSISLPRLAMQYASIARLLAPPPSAKDSDHDHDHGARRKTWMGKGHDILRAKNRSSDKMAIALIISTEAVESTETVWSARVAPHCGTEKGHTRKRWPDGSAHTINQIPKVVHLEGCPRALLIQPSISERDAPSRSGGPWRPTAGRVNCGKESYWIAAVIF